ncbi:MAG: tRNA preQ1(34) S-adenosylmethionine ribosyltransferase-isomerase QueA [Candidatus Ryanbacteria bacterium RIFCSPHIGHO2_02_FULL_48_12]|uniref:S-adenosylmethionine:tRNA ribosyltransferase-isomerase n=1 Tax=Candidatus Ryanbacteria bacterium RIFCSPHIGHO2_01_FULL_48_27 TaxID=1802115 RepID=A0A1G2G767_9BACT|nr:MAG: tRNA preQ1(34) S-adenosylmethionine ribosyltransferase-isomerase QueA [Candidatus Ryanbacteria bacterium RIFCSPHIGHO2_01_FULL_48_27]OGZ49838.1 MAG: tRNA preQ1(34) S-adenosylmethionine ribosyltransferase-isomerase QueA [Candidatus Ryanbacteria bacterium RIFCSPHIGHO2_02_FULL_48_12]
MPSSLERVLKQYDYMLPERLVAKCPVTPRDAARMLVYQRATDTIRWDTFLHLPKYLPKGAVLVFNKTKVFPARLKLKKETGGTVKILYVKHDARYLYALCDKPLRNGMKLSLGGVVRFAVRAKKEAVYTLVPHMPVSKVMELFLRYGETPIPPYIKNSPLSESRLRKEYQTVFASALGSVAAPTASLHFTKRLLSRIKKSGCDIAFVTLHVNLGTFAPITQIALRTGRLHEEYYEIDARTKTLLESAKRAGRPIIAVGTTVVRTLESAADKKGVLQRPSGFTDLFIREKYQFRFVDGIITNFHVPKSSLLILVAAFAGQKNILDLYQTAIKKKFRFFSFGDGMLILGSKIPNPKAK